MYTPGKKFKAPPAFFYNFSAIETAISKIVLVMVTTVFVAIMWLLGGVPDTDISCMTPLQRATREL